MEKINLDVIINDIKIEMDDTCLFFIPMTIEKGSDYVRLKDFRCHMLSTRFIRFLTRFCDERNLIWIVNFDSKSVIIS